MESIASIKLPTTNMHPHDTQELLHCKRNKKMFSSAAENIVLTKPIVTEITSVCEEREISS